MKRSSPADLDAAAVVRADAAWELAGAKAAAAFRKRRYEEALDLVEAKIAAGGDDAWLFALRGEVKRAPGLGKESEAAEDAARASAAAPDCFWIRGYAGRAFAQSGKLAEAKLNLDRALELAPQCGWALEERALVRLALGDAEGGRQDAVKAGADLTLASCLLGAGKPAEALEALTRAQAAAEEADRSFPGAARPDALVMRFETLRGLGRWTDAARTLRELALGARRFTWTAPEADARRLAESLRDLSLASATPELKAWLGFWKGDALLRLSRLEEADKELSAAVAADGALFWPRAWRAWCRLRLGKLAEAAPDADAALALPEGKKAWRAQLLGLRGELGVRLGDCAGAAADLTLALEAGAKPAGPTFARARAYAALGKIKEAQSDLNAVLALEPRHAPACLLRAQLRSKQGNLAGALCDLNRAKALGKPGETWLKLEPPDPEAARGSTVAPARRLGEAAVEPLIELVGLIQAVLDGRPFLIDAVKPRGESTKGDTTRNRQEKMTATRGPRSGPEIAAEMTLYAQEAVARFSPHIDAPLREVFLRAVAIQGNAASPWYGLSQMMMSVTQPPRLKGTGPEWRHPENMRLLAGLETFIERSGFWDFFESRRPQFAKWTRDIRAIMCREAYAERVSGYVGVSINAYYDVILSPLLRDVTLCAILKSDGAMGARTVMCPLSHVSEFYRAYDEDYLLWRGWHEILHMVIDRWTEAHLPEIAPLEPLHALLKGGARRHDWRDCVAEHMVRAVTQRILRQTRGRLAMARLAQRDRLEGYLFQDKFAKSLEVFETSRGVYPTLLDYLPEWLKVLSSWPQRP